MKKQKAVKGTLLSTCAMGLALAATPVNAEVVEQVLTNPADTTDVWGKKITGLGDDGDEVALVFTNTAHTTEDPMQMALPVGVDKVWYLVVGGGGSGGAEYGNYYAGAGGGGAGGMLEEREYPIESPNLSVIVGQGGAAVVGASNGKDGNNGGDSTLSFVGTNVVAHGGGGGGAYRYGTAKGGGLKGGSGGGGGRLSTGVGGACYDGEGNVGGSGTGYADHLRGGGGGGGAGGEGESTNASKGGKGGDGAVSAIGGGFVSKYKDEGGNEYYCAGGGGGFASTAATQNPGLGGLGGGGKGGGDTGVSATNYGCGGGGTKGNGSTSTRKSGAGYQGVVIVRYAMPAGVVELPMVTNKVYNGDVQTADIEENPAYTIVNQGGTDVGEYPVELTLHEGYKWADGTTHATNFTFAITPAQNAWTQEPSVEPSSWIASAETKGVLTPATTQFGAPTAMIAKDGGEPTPFTEMPTTEPGNYVLTYTSESTDNWLAPTESTKTVPFKIISDDVTPEFTVAFDGDIATGAGTTVTATVPFRVSCAFQTEKTANVSAQYALEGSDTTNAVTYAESVPLNEGTGVIVLPDLLPGTNYWVALYGQGGETVTNTPFQSFATINPAGDLVAEFSRDTTNFIISGSVLTRIGETTVTVHYSHRTDVCDQTAMFGPFSVGTTNFELRVDIQGFDDSICWYVTVENNYSGAVWSRATEPQTNGCWDMEKVSYTWQGGETGDWYNVANWKANKTVCYGVPDSSLASATFADAATVNLGGTTIELLTGVNVQSFILPANKTVTLTNGTLTLPLKRIASNCHLCLKDGGQVDTTRTSGSSAEACVFAQGGVNGVLELAGNAKVIGDVNTYSSSSVGNTVRVRGENNVVTGDLINQAGRLFVDVRDGSLEARGLNIWGGSANPLELSVSNATVKVTTFGANHAAKQADHRRKFDIFIPASGLAQAPITVTTPYDLTTAAYFDLTCDKTFIGGNVPLISGIKTIPGTLVDNTTLPDGFKVEYTLEDGILYARLKHDGFMFFVK